MALPKDFLDTNDFTKEQILAIEDLGLAMKKASRLTASILTCSVTRALA